MYSMCRADPVASCSPSVCVGGKLQILLSSPPLILLALTCVVSVAPPVGGADARQGQDGIEVDDLEGGRRQASDSTAAYHGGPCWSLTAPPTGPRPKGSTGCQNQWRHFRLHCRKSILTMWGCMTHVSRPVVVHVIGFCLSSQGLHSTVGYSALLCGAACHSREEPRPGISVRSWTGLSGDAWRVFPQWPSPIPPSRSGGPLSNRQLPQRTRRKGEGAEDDEAGTTAFPFLLEAGQAEVGPCFSFSCAHVLMCPFLYPLPLAPSLSFRSRIIAGDCAQRNQVLDPRALLESNQSNHRFSLPCPVSPHQSNVFCPGLALWAWCALVEHK